MRNKSGFTMIELIVVVSVVLIFLGMTLVQFNSYNETLKVQNQAKKLVDVIELAEKKALTSDLYDTTCTNFNGYQITLTANNYSLYFCCNSVCTTDLQTYSLNSDTTNQNISITTTGNINFPPLMTGFKSTVSPIHLRNSVIGKCAVITVSGIGVIDLSDSLISC